MLSLAHSGGLLRIEECLFTSLCEQFVLLGVAIFKVTMSIINQLLIKIQFACFASCYDLKLILRLQLRQRIERVKGVNRSGKA